MKFGTSFLILCLYFWTSVTSFEVLSFQLYQSRKLQLSRIRRLISGSLVIVKKKSSEQNTLALISRTIQKSSVNFLRKFFGIFKESQAINDVDDIFGDDSSENYSDDRFMSSKLASSTMYDDNFLLSKDQTMNNKKQVLSVEQMVMKDGMGMISVDEKRKLAKLEQDKQYTLKLLNEISAKRTGKAFQAVTLEDEDGGAVSTLRTTRKTTQAPVVETKQHENTQKNVIAVDGISSSPATGLDRDRERTLLILSDINKRYSKKKPAAISTTTTASTSASSSTAERIRTSTQATVVPSVEVLMPASPITSLAASVIQLNDQPLLETPSAVFATPSELVVPFEESIFQPLYFEEQNADTRTTATTTVAASLSMPGEYLTKDEDQIEETYDVLAQILSPEVTPEKTIFAFFRDSFIVTAFAKLFSFFLGTGVH